MRNINNNVVLRVDNKREKRVSNALYALCKISAESHAPGVQKYTNENIQFKWYIVGVALSAR